MKVGVKRTSDSVAEERGYGGGYENYGYGDEGYKRVRYGEDFEDVGQILELHQ